MVSFLECITRRIAPVSGSRSIRASVGAKVVGIALLMARRSLRSLVLLLASFSVPPVAEFRREESPSRL